jgi:hypothetical protein
MDGIAIEIQTEERRPKCPLISYGKVQKLIRKTSRRKGLVAESYVINVTPIA